VKFSQQSFQEVADLFEQASGIRYGPEKKDTVAMRLLRLARLQGCEDLDAYVESALRVTRDPGEMRRIVDRLTTNETYFFREPAHFELLERLAARRGPGRPFRFWSAACSSGEEAYSAAMVLAERFGLDGDWDVMGTDLSTEMIAAARAGLYPMERIDGVSPARLKRYCRRGSGPYEGKLLVARELRARTRFEVANLARPLPPALRLGRFDAIFLRNVLIYFRAEQKKAIVERVAQHLAEGGCFFIGHSETLTGVTWELAAVQPAVYERAG
jgi:chemotaxis protein methyltransferase CheR